MDGALLVALALIVLVLSAVAFVPLFLSWPQRVRWAVSAQAAGHAGFGLAVCVPLDLREVVLVSVHTSGSTLALGVAKVGRPPSDTLTFVRTPTPAGDVVPMLREWCALRTPMLLHIEANGSASLHGPAAAVADLRRIGTRAARDAAVSAHRSTARSVRLAQRQERAISGSRRANDPQNSAGRPNSSAAPRLTP